MEAADFQLRAAEEIREEMLGDIQYKELAAVIIACSAAVVSELRMVREELAGFNQGVTGL